MWNCGCRGYGLPVPAFGGRTPAIRHVEFLHLTTSRHSARHRLALCFTTAHRTSLRERLRSSPRHCLLWHHPWIIRTDGFFLCMLSTAYHRHALPMEASTGH